MRPSNNFTRRKRQSRDERKPCVHMESLGSILHRTDTSIVEGRNNLMSRDERGESLGDIRNNSNIFAKHPVASDSEQTVKIVSSAVAPEKTDNFILDNLVKSQRVALGKELEKEAKWFRQLELNASDRNAKNSLQVAVELRLNEYKKKLADIYSQSQEFESRYKIFEQKFISYLERTKEIKYLNLHDNNGEIAYGRTCYTHRWSDQYIRKFWKKVYQLQDWVKIRKLMHDAEPLMSLIPVTFATITVKQEFLMPYEEAFIKLAAGWDKLRDYMQRRGYQLSYLRGMDFHKSGYPHYHILFFNEFAAEDVKTFKELWEKWEMGSSKFGLDFKKADKTGKPIDRIISYLFKHSGKVFYAKDKNHKAGWLRFHSVVWMMQHDREEKEKEARREAFQKVRPGGHDDMSLELEIEEEDCYSGIRLFTASKDIVAKMKLPENDDFKTLVMVDDQSKKLYVSPDFDKEKVQDYLEFMKTLDF